jgi:hypothetical protein
VSSGALEVIEGILDRGGDADDVLREIVAALVERGGCAWAGILFHESGELALGPEAGTPVPDERAQLAVVFQGDHVAELVADGCGDRALLERVAAVVAPYCLVGWDTGGVPWDALG